MNVRGGAFLRKYEISMQHRLGRAIYSAMLLVEKGRFVGAVLLQRPAAEALVDLVALTKDDAYLEFMVASFDEQWIRLLKSGMNGNPFLAALWGDPDVQKEYAVVEQELKDLKNRGFRELSVKERFTRVGMLNEYESVYNSLCCETHNNIRALFERHIDEDEHGTVHIAVDLRPKFPPVFGRVSGF